jgi:hypothetical protein
LFYDRAGAAAFQKMAERALLFAGLGKVRDPASVFRREQLCEGRLNRALRENQSHVVIAATSRAFMVKLINEVTNLESFFPGLRRLCALFPCYSCRTKRTKVKLALDNPPVTSEEVSSGLVLSDTAMASSDGAGELDQAEEQDLVAQQYLQPAAMADALNCGAYYAEHKALLARILHEQYQDLGALLAFEEDGELAIDFAEESLLRMTYGMETPRFYQEVSVPMALCNPANRFLTRATFLRIGFNRDDARSSCCGPSIGGVQNFAER